MGRVREAVRMWTRDSDHRPWAFWISVMWVMAGGYVTLGLIYLTNFSVVALTSAAYAAFLHVPGGLHTYGALQLAIGIMLGAGLTRPTRWSSVKLMYVLAMNVTAGTYAAVTALAFFAAPVVGGERNAGWAVWAIIAAVLIVALPFAPTQHGLPSRSRWTDDPPGASGDST